MEPGDVQWGDRSRPLGIRCRDLPGKSRCKLKYVSVLVLTILAACGASSWAQTATGTLRGQVTDPSGAVVTNATVAVRAPAGRTLSATTNRSGAYEIGNLAPGKYTVTADAKGFATFVQTDVEVAADQTAQLNIALEIRVQKEKVNVQEETPQVDVNPASNANTIVLQGKDLEALSDDPDELESELQALAGPSAGPNGGQMYIDGFTAGQLPPKASIREIRINQNPFSSEYDRLGYGRVEIFTKPGTDTLHGQFMISGNDAAFNARNPFEILPANTAAPGYHSEQFSGNIGGAINKKASFFFNIEQRDIEALSIVSAADPNPYNPAVANPQTRTNVSPRIDYQLTPNNTLTARYQYYRDSETNDGVGQFNEAAVGTDYLSTEHTLQITDTQTINTSTINEIRFQYVHDNTLTTPVSTAINVNVGGAFSNNGSGGGNIADTQNRFEVQDIVYKNFRKHAMKFGGRLRSTNDLNSTAANFSGTFTFGAQSLLTCTPTPQTPCPTETPLQVYETTQTGLAAGLTIPEIQQLYGYGGASYYSQTFGTPSTSVTLVDAGLFVQDDWKLRPNVTISYGLRFETQNNFSDKSDFAPRFGIAWGIGGNAKNPPKTVLRAGFGIFYDRFTYDLVETQQRYNELSPLQQQLQIQNPVFFLPIPNPVPSGTLVSTQYADNNNLRAPYTMQTGITLERQLTKVANIAVTYLNSRGVHQFYTNNLNPFIPSSDPSGGARPLPNEGNILQYQSEGTFKQNQLIVNGSIRMGAKLSLFGYYTYNRANSDTSGVNSFPSNPLNLSEDYGRASFDIRNRLFLGGTIGLPRGFRLSPFMIASSGIPFNITTGTDPYQDNLYNVRPAFAVCTPSNQTKFGCFDTTPAPGATPIPINFGEGPGRFTMNLRLSKTFGFGPAIEGASGSGGGGMGGMGGGTFGRGPGGGGRGGQGGRGMDASTNHRYSLTFGVIGRNIFNNVN